MGVPLLLVQASRVRRGDHHANNITQKALTLLTEDADDAPASEAACCASNARFEGRYTRHMPLVLRARLSSPCRPEKAAEAELSRM